MKILLFFLVLLAPCLGHAQGQQSLYLTVVNDIDTLPGAKYYTLSLEVFNADSTSQIIELDFVERRGKLTHQIVLSEETVKILSESSWVNLKVSRSFIGHERFITTDTTACRHYDREYSLPLNFNFEMINHAHVEIRDFCSYQSAQISIWEGQEEPKKEGYQYFTYQVKARDSEWNYYYFQGMKKWKRLEYIGNP